MEIIQFIFSSFWTWLGTVVLIVATGEAIATVLKALPFGRHKKEKER